MIDVVAGPVLHKKNVQGMNQYWQSKVVSDGIVCYVTTGSWADTVAGGTTKGVWSTPKVAKPKNVGKSNETTSEQQAVLEMASRMKKKRDEGYVEDGQEYVGKPLAMLALKFAKAKHRVEYPCYVQPKLDGERACSDDDSWWSRTGLPHIEAVTEHLNFDHCGTITDGEFILPVPGTEHLAVPKAMKLQDTSKAVSKYYPDDSLYATNRLLYFVFDLMEANVPFNDRLEHMRGVDLNTLTRSDNVRFVPTYRCEDESDIMMYHSQFCADGYEGTIVRSAKGIYKFGHRVAELIKLKDMIDDEFKIVNIVEGTGSHAGSAMYVCLTHDEQHEFVVNPEGSIPSRQAVWQIFQSMPEMFIGKWLNVRYQALNESNVPSFAVGVMVRPDRDTDR